ncbi:coiled-coil domain-containing protein 172-like [Spinachia spinachia]
MSLDTLYQQILVTEQQLTEQTQKVKEVKVATIRCKEKIKSASEKNGETCEELDKKAQQLSAMRLQHDLMKKCEHQMLNKVEELLGLRSQQRDRLTQILRECKEEEENFLREISMFNSDFSLCGNKSVVFQSQTRAEILDLQREVESLYKEMELMSRSNNHVSAMQEERRTLQLTLRSLERTQRDLERRLIEAEATTASLGAESLSVSRRPLTDATCLRLRKELQMHKEDELELLRAALSSEIHFLKSKLDSSQAGEQR